MAVVAPVRPATKHTETVARYGSVAVLLVLAVQTVWAVRGLFADGGFYLWFILNHETFFFTTRYTAQALTQAPVLGAIGLGIHDVSTLARIQSFGTGALPILIWAAALLVVRQHRSFWMFVLGFSVSFLTSGFMTVGEYNFAHALVALSAALLLTGPQRLGARVALLLAAVALIASYESLLFLGPLLIVFAVIHRRSLEATWFWSLVVAYGLATIYSAYWIVFPRDAANLRGAASITDALAHNPALALSLIIAATYVALWLFGSPLVQRVGTFVLAGGSTLLLLPALWATPGMHYEARTLAAVALFGILAAVALREVRPREQKESANLWVASAALLLALSVPFSDRTVGFAHWLAAFEVEALTSGGPTSLEETDLIPERTDLYGWSWTHPYLSVLLHTDEGQVVILRPDQVPSDDVSVPDPIDERFVDDRAPLFG